MASVGGGRGRGRGRGGFGGGGGGGRFGGGGGAGGGVRSLPMGDLSWSDFMEADKAQPNRHAYPPIEEQPIVRKPNEREIRIIARQLAFIDGQRQTPWWTKPLDEQQKNGKQQQSSVAGTSTSASHSNSTSSSVNGIKRSSAYLPRYSDKKARLNAVNTNGQQQGGSTSFDSLTLQDPALLELLQKPAFPNGLWRSYVEGETRRNVKRQEAAEKARKRMSDWKKIVLGVEQQQSGLGGLKDDGSDAGIFSDDDADFEERDEYEDDMEDDYADNYFDNGEDDDIPEEGGGEAEDVYE